MGKRLDDRRLSAKEAAEIADKSEIMLARIYKIIREEAEEGRVRLNWGTEYLSKKCLANIIKDLEDNGYTVSSENHELVIQW
jgi:hypothetical protein